MRVYEYDGTACNRLLSFRAFGTENSSGSVRLAVGDTDGDGTDEIITGQEGGASRVRVFDGTTGTRLCSFRSFGTENASGSVRLAAGDVNGDGADEIIVGQEGGASRVRVYDYDGTACNMLLSFRTYGTENTSGSVRLAVGDTDGDGTDEIIAGQEQGMPRVRVFDGTTGSRLCSFRAFGSENASGSVRLASGDVNGDGTDEIIVGQEGGASRVRAYEYDGTACSMSLSFRAFGTGNTSGSVRLTTGMEY